MTTLMEKLDSGNRVTSATMFWTLGFAEGPTLPGRYATEEEARHAAPAVAEAEGRRLGGRWPIHVRLFPYPQWEVTHADGSTSLPSAFGGEWSADQVVAALNEHSTRV